jgi:tetratricopeptide (TPR) repeat protein
MLTTLAAKGILLLALLAQASTSSPAGPTEDKAKAKALLREGLTLNQRGEHAQALEKFEAAYAAYPSPKLWFNIGQVQLDLGQPAEAMAAFEKFLAFVPDAQPEDKRVAKAAVAQLGKKLGRLQVKCETPGAEVVVDGKSQGKLPLAQPIWAAAGNHQVTITHEGFAPATETVEMTAGTTALVVLRLAPVQPPGPAAPIAVPAPAESLPAAALSSPAVDFTAQPAPEEARPIYKTWWFWTGAAVVVVGTVTTAVLLSRSGGSNVPNAPLGHYGAFQ